VTCGQQNWGDPNTEYWVLRSDHVYDLDTVYWMFGSELYQEFMQESDEVNYDANFVLPDDYLLGDQDAPPVYAQERHFDFLNDGNDGDSALKKQVDDFVRQGLTDTQFNTINNLTQEIRRNNKMIKDPKTKASLRKDLVKQNIELAQRHESYRAGLLAGTVDPDALSKIQLTTADELRKIFEDMIPGSES
jgi:hypothetical protein